MTDESMRIGEAGLDVLWFHPRIALEDRLVRVTCGEHAKDMLHGEPATSNDRLSSKDTRVDRDALEENVFVIRGRHSCKS